MNAPSSTPTPPHPGGEGGKAGPGPQPESSSDRILVSVIVPTYNHADILPVCLKALLAQDFPRDRYEIIVVDDGSTDRTREIVAQFAGQAPEVRYRHQPNQGPAAARNQGAAVARGAILMFTDDDCEPEPTWISEMQRPFLDPALDVAAVKGAYRTRQESVVARFVQTEFETRYRQLRESPIIDFVDTYAAAFRRDVFARMKGFDISFPKANNEDVEFSYRLAEQGYRMVFADKAIVYHRHPDTLFKYLKVKFGRAYWRMVVYRQYPGKMKADSYTPQSLKLQIGLMFLLLLTAAGLVLDPTTYRLPAALIAVVFVLSTLPFLAVVANAPVLTRLLAVLNRPLSLRGLAAWTGPLARLVAGGPLGCAARAARRALGAVALGGIRGLRLAARSRAIRAAARGLRAAGYALVEGIGLLFQGIWRLLLLPFVLARLLIRGTAWLLRRTARLPAVRAVRRALNRLACTRPLMVPISLVLLLLRSLVMGLGIFWGLQSKRSPRGRFSQVLLLLAGDAAGIALACVAAYYSRTYLLASLLGHSGEGLAAYVVYLPLIVACLLTVFYLSGLYNPFKGFSQVTEFVVLSKVVGAFTVVVAIWLYLLGVRHMRVFLVFMFFYMLGFVTYIRWLVRKGCARLAPRGEEETSVLIVGTGEVGRLICRRLTSNPNFGTRVAGFVDENPGRVGEPLEGCEIIGSFADLGDVIDRHRIHDVFVSLPMMPQADVLDLIDRHSRRLGPRFHIVSNLFDLISAEIDIAEHSNIPIASLRNENMALAQVFAKRVFDIVASVLMILLTFPFWILIMIAIRLETDGPAIFRQERVGKDGRIFSIYKFRTMYSNTAKFEYSPSSPDDKRVTRTGRFLRRTSLDEFPQFVNVLKGEMSLVGPRPEMPFIVDQYKDWERQRLRVKPGLTGLWQIMGRKDLPLHESLEFDFYYIKNQSLLLDLSILIRTVAVILRGKGAY